MQARRREEGGEKEGEDEGVERLGERLSHGGHAPSNLTPNAKTAFRSSQPPPKPTTACQTHCLYGKLE